MVSMFTSSEVDCEVVPQSGQAKDYKIVASPLSTHQYGERAKTSWLRIRTMCPNGSTCLSADCYFSELAL